MLMLLALLVVWCWWLLWPFMSMQRGFFMREVPVRDETEYTQTTKSLYFNTLTVNKFMLYLFLGGIGMGWAAVSLITAGGWALLWAGFVWLNWYNWDGHLVGWVGVIRGVWVVNPGSHLVVCFFLLCWSLGNYILFISNTYPRLLIRGHLRRLVFGYVSGFDIYPGDIRKDQLGGLSLRCSPTCSPTLMLETLVGFRNQSVPANFSCVGLGWTEGWVRGWASNLWWPKKLSLYSKGSLGILGWVNLGTLMLLEVSYRATSFQGIQNWLHKTGLLGRIDIMYSLLDWHRGNIVTKDWNNITMLHGVLVWKFLLYFCMWLIKMYEHNQSIQRYQNSAGNPWDGSWRHIFWVGIKAFWMQGKLWFKCYQPSSCYCNREKNKKVDNLSVVPQGYLRLFRLDNKLSESAVNRLGSLCLCICCTKLVDMLDISSVYCRGNSVYYYGSRMTRVCCLKWCLDSGVGLCLVSKENGWVMRFTLSLPDSGSRVVYGKKTKNWLHQSVRYWCYYLWYFCLVWPRDTSVIRGWVRLSVMHIKLARKSQNWLIWWLDKLVYWLYDHYKGSVLLLDVSRVYFGYQGLVYRAPSFFCDCLSLLLWSGDVMQLYSSSTGPDSVFHKQTEVYQLHTGYGLEVYLKELSWSKWIWSVWFRSWAVQLGSQMTTATKTQSMGFESMMHGIQAWSWIYLWAWFFAIWVYINMGRKSCKLHFPTSVWSRCIYGSVHTCGLVPLVWVTISIRYRYSIPCNARFHCIPSIGRMVSYFWSPKPVLGDVMGGMPP
ncbi:hypothetical protein Hanom_Chr15g01337131 [Helianthus anomalus]